jgi:hypothetical protein
MKPLLADTALDPSPADIEAGAAHLREVLRIRKSSPLFRLPTEADINKRVTFFNGPDALLVMGLDDGAMVPDLDRAYEYIMVLFNANKVPQSITLPQAIGKGFTLHPVQLDAVDADPVVQKASFDDVTGTFSIPARTTAVFVSPEPPGFWSVYETQLKGAKYVDLTHTLTPAIPVWAGFGRSRFSPALNRS